LKPAVLLWLATIAAAGARPAPVESIRARGLLAFDTLYLFGEVHRCGADDRALPEAQIFISTDGGKSWHKRGPAIPGSQILFAGPQDRTIWAAGEHTAEGPATDPFVLAPRKAAEEARPDWAPRTVAEGPGELIEVAMPNMAKMVPVARGKEVTSPEAARPDTKEVIARVRPTGPHGERRPGPDREYVSHDAGGTWSLALPGELGQKAGWFDLPPISMHSGPWRLVDRPDGGFDVQMHSAAGFSTVSSFPWTPCPK
jgi:hypothetical protein